MKKKEKLTFSNFPLFANTHRKSKNVGPYNVPTFVLVHPYGAGIVRGSVGGACINNATFILQGGSQIRGAPLLFGVLIAKYWVFRAFGVNSGGPVQNLKGVQKKFSHQFLPTKKSFLSAK